jgi:hypothetical protein
MSGTIYYSLKQYFRKVNGKRDHGMGFLAFKGLLYRRPMEREVIENQWLAYLNVTCTFDFLLASVRKMTKFVHVHT